MTLNPFVHDGPKLLTPDERDHVRASRVDALQEFVDAVAACTCEIDYPEDGPDCVSSDDAVETMTSLVRWARTLSDRRPEPDKEASE